MSSLDPLQAALTARLGDRVKKLERAFGELTLTVGAADYHDTALLLRDDAALAVEELAPAPQGLLSRRRRAGHCFAHRNLELGELVRARSLRPLRDHLRGPSRPAPHPHRLRLHRPSVPER